MTIYLTFFILCLCYSTNYSRAEKWVEAVYDAFLRKKAVWEKEADNGGESGALDEWGTPARMGERHLNPAFDLTASGTAGAATTPYSIRCLVSLSIF